MSLRALILLVACLLGLPAEGAGVLRYRVAVPAELDRLRVRVCVDGWVPTRFSSRTPGADRFISDPQPADGSPTVSIRDGVLRLQANEGDCFRYLVDLESALDRESGRMILRQGTDLLLGSGVWLWRPQEIPPGGEIRVRFVLPDGYRVSVPWQPVRAAGGSEFRLGGTPAQWPDLMAIGRFAVQELDVRGSTLRLAVLDGDPAARPQDMSAWIGEAAGAVATLYGRFPLGSPQILVVPRGEGPEAVPWAQVLRGGGAAAHFFVDPSRPLGEFRDDWTAAHELSHMLLPYVERDDAWLSEGFASYYQNVLRARAGMLDPGHAWDKLYQGFERGRNGTRGKTLAAASRSMGRDRAFMRVYWSGAAIALSADVELRRRTRGTHSLDTAMAALRECCLPSERAWSASEVFDRLDAATSETVFDELYDRYVHDRRFPELGSVSRHLGIVEKPGGLRFDAAPAAVELRDAIMSTPARLSQSEVALDQQESAIH
jgi:hypothetical protein